MTGAELMWYRCAKTSSLPDGPSCRTIQSRLSAWAQSRPGTELLCVGLVRGVMDTTRNFHSPACVPQDASPEQAVRLVVDHLDEAPDSLDQADTSLILAALASAYPCR